MKPDERAFAEALRAAHGGPFNPAKGRSPRELIPEIGINHKRAWYLLEKWAGRDWYDYGVTLDLGWITQKGWEEMANARTDLREIRFLLEPDGQHVYVYVEGQGDVPHICLGWHHQVFPHGKPMTEILADFIVTGDYLSAEQKRPPDFPIDLAAVVDQAVATMQPAVEAENSVAGHGLTVAIRTALAMCR